MERRDDISMGELMERAERTTSRAVQASQFVERAKWIERILAWFKIEQHEQAEPASSEIQPKQTILAAAIGHAVRPADGKLPQDALEIVQK